jgi:hypothetical protein
MMVRIVAAQRPQFGLQPRQRYTCAGVRGQPGPGARQAFTSPSERMLQEQTIIGSLV